ncbi:3-deoxy-D-manno-octulosonic acid transferase [Haliscomenobacter hydrossis]|uniref:3-deoxy-D-manno-octulosonic acid transferase n=1 Tax=Haliscomenobacter hydrossis (strain ATCC 27775 / DSM 1100 / LMG 10767 / O) TaxID=760192 RepID=F4L684_HALH1|nr:glycosyltransferase N-terminal domain-containing protein [Haliscomenobacter hydrossis]AEE54102.1 Three-deoxy-D-manno-octulosonic-acid transferase domain-containing protein [Haliscomenobacter hydrossis DSM 1100]
MQGLYTTGIRLYVLLIRLAAFFHPKAKLWWRGRKNWSQNLSQALASKRKSGQMTIWLHSASLGEFEQGRPLIEAVKSQHPEVFILLTFFSPSGYEIRKNYAGADLVCYLPPDLRRNARQFLGIVQPQLAVFVKYEFWYNFLQELQREKIPVWLIAALFRPQQPFFQSWGAWYFNVLKGFDHFFVQNQESADLLKKYGIQQYTLAGDPRIDRVLQIAAEGKQFPTIEAFKKDASILMAGSTWTPDEAALAQLWSDPKQYAGWKLIIAPHEIESAHLEQIEQKFPGQCVRFSRFQPERHQHLSVLIIDNIGMLSALYRYAEIAYIGGGLGSGIHNTLEPMAFGLPVIFGPKYQKFTEAVATVELGGAFVVHSAAELIKIFDQLKAPAFTSKASSAVQTYLQQNQGATAKIMQRLEQYLYP